jgi:hypothetical protein
MSFYLCVCVYPLQFLSLLFDSFHCIILSSLWLNLFVGILIFVAFFFWQ